MRINKLQKISAEDAQRILDALPSVPWTATIREELTAAIAELASDRSSAAMAQVESLVDQANYESLLAQANEKSVAWATERVGNLVTDVDATTRQLINEMNAEAIADGLTNEEFASMLEESFAFSGDRAELIARTETAEAETQGALAGYRESGVVEGKEWAADAEACDECLALDGVIVPLDEDFPDDGGDGPPLHPRCECFVAPVVADDPDA